MHAYVSVHVCVSVSMCACARVAEMAWLADTDVRVLQNIQLQKLS